MKIIRLMLILLVFTAGYSAFSQIDKDFEEVKKQMQKEFEQYVQQNQKEFDQYVEEIDKEFSDYLKQAWEEFRLFAGVKPDTTPKLKILPKYDPLTRIPPPKELLLETPKPTPDLNIPPSPSIPPIQKSEPPETEKKKLEIDFYGAPATIQYDQDLEFDFPSSFTNEEIAGYWKKVSTLNYQSLLNQLLTLKNSMNLNDWGYYLLVNQVAGKISTSTNTSRLLAWYLMTKSAYKMRVAYAENNIYLLFPAANIIYGIKYFIFDNVRYYAPDYPYDKIVTYEKDFPDANTIMDLNVRKALNIGDKMAERPFRINYNDKDYNLTIAYNLNAVEFYKDFPLCELKVYFDAAINPATKESLLHALKPLIENRSEADAVGFLLNFVQNGFNYKVDPEQFNGMEKFFFPEEDFHYPFSDCDDRAVLFAWLVRELTGLKVVGVVYPGHVATAVCFNTDVPGDYVTWDKEKYVIADPTYINAPVGMTMPGMVNEKAQIIPLANTQNQAVELADTWEIVRSFGGQPGDNNQNLVTDNDGNSYVTGYFTGQATFGKTVLNTVNQKNDAFIAKIDLKGTPLWAVNLGGEGNDLGYNIVRDGSGNIYISGCFSKVLRLGSKSVVAPGFSDIYVAKFDPNGNLLWLNQAGLDTTSGTSDYIFVASFTPGGEHIATKLYPENESFSSYGLSFDEQGNLYYTASYTSTIGLNIDLISLGMEAGFNVISTLKEENDKQLAANCEKTIAGLFAAITLVRVNNVAISGKSVQETFLKYNPGFKTIAPKVYQSIGKVQVMKNNEGIVTVSTEGQEPVVLDKIKINNDARLKVTTLPAGDVKIEVLGGVKVGKAIIWFPLNYVRLFRTNGNVLFDYDSDHSQVTMNMKKDMLF